MRLIAISIVIFSGAVLAAAGTIAEALTPARVHIPSGTFGLLLVGASTLLFVLEWWPLPGTWRKNQGE